MRVAVGKRTFPLQIGKRLLAIPHNVKGNGLRHRSDSDLKQFHVVLIIFHHKDVLGLASFSCKHNSPCHIFPAWQPRRDVFSCAPNYRALKAMQAEVSPGEVAVSCKTAGCEPA